MPNTDPSPCFTTQSWGRYSIIIPRREKGWVDLGIAVSVQPVQKAAYRSNFREKHGNLSAAQFDPGTSRAADERAYHSTTATRSFSNANLTFKHYASHDPANSRISNEKDLVETDCWNCADCCTQSSHRIYVTETKAPSARGSTASAHQPLNLYPCHPLCLEADLYLQ